MKVVKTRNLRVDYIPEGADTSQFKDSRKMCIVRHPRLDFIPEDMSKEDYNRATMSAKEKKKYDYDGDKAVEKKENADLEENICPFCSKIFETPASRRGHQANCPMKPGKKAK